MTDLERRVARLEAREQIRDLVAEYSMAVDDRDIPTIARLFAADAVFAHADGTMTVEGRDAIAEFYASRLGSMGPTFHYPHSHRIEFVDDDNATGVVLAHAELAYGDSTMYTGLRYLDRYVCRDDGWEFADRQLKFVFFMPLADFVAGGLGHENRKRYPGQEPVPTDLPEGQASYQTFVAG